MLCLCLLDYFSPRSYHIQTSLLSVSLSESVPRGLEHRQAIIPNLLCKQQASELVRDVHKLILDKGEHLQLLQNLPIP